MDVLITFILALFVGLLFIIKTILHAKGYISDDMDQAFDEIFSCFSQA